jgi:hypothetical protein
MSMSHLKIILMEKIWRWTKGLYYREEDLDLKEAMRVIVVLQILEFEKIEMIKYHFP